MEEQSGEMHNETPRPGLYQCGFCKKNYARSDHLIRHVRSHTSERPFKCEICYKGFGRMWVWSACFLPWYLCSDCLCRDLLRRHAQSHGSAQRHPRVHASSATKVRVSQACRSCAKAKLKCDNDKPCRRCAKRKIVCQWSQRGASPDSLRAQELDFSPVSNVDCPNVGESYLSEEPGNINALDSQPSDRDGIITDSLSNPQPSMTQSYGDLTTGPCMDLPGFNDLSTTLAEHDRLPLMSPDDYDMIGRDILDLGLTDGDLEFLDSLNNQDALYGNWTTDQIPREDLPSDTEPADLVDSNAYHESPLANWTPRTEDNAYMDQEYLSVPKHLNNPKSTAPKPRVSAEHLSKEIRDSAFAIVVQMCQRRNVTRIMQCFPSAELLDSLIQDYFLRQRTQLDTWIHGPSMQLNKECPDMILALAAAGAVVSPVEAIQKLGYALLEIARLHLCQKYEENNSITRHLRQQQAYTLLLHTGLWSGHKRRLEIAESFEQPIVTMLRRSPRFKAQAYPTIIPAADDRGEVLDQKWHQWVESESFKRLIYHLFIHDIQASVLFSINPLIAHSELHIPLPISRKLWDAKTATQWKSVYLQSMSTPSEPTPSLTQTLQDVSILNRFQNQIDFSLAGFLSVHGMFSIVMDCNRARHGPSLHLRTLVFQTWQHELQQILEQFEIAAVEPLKSSIPGISLIYQTVSLSLYIPLGDLEVFAGKEGLKRSSDVHEGIIKHISPTNLRQAIWHAGQVYRIAKSMPRESLTGFCATCLYFAALALWMYSVVSTGDNNRGEVEKQDIFPLDTEIDSAALRRFTISGYGTPVLSSGEHPVYLDNKAAVMRLFQQVLWSKHSGNTVHSQTRALYNAFSALGSLTGMKGLDPSSTGVRDV